jgi:chromosomal replication initiator protein
LAQRTPQGLWETALGQLELQITRPNFETWLRNTTGLQLSDHEFSVGAPTDFAVEWLRQQMNPLANRTVSQLLGRDVCVSFQVLGAPATPAPAPALSPSPQAGAGVSAGPDLDPTLTFQSFTVVRSNRVAHRAARRLAAAEGRYYPLVLQGSTGLGKTHLLHAIGHEAIAAGRRVVALTSEAFVNEYATASRKGHPYTFRDLFDGCELFLLDDLPFLASRSASQEQFFHIFDVLKSSRARIVITSETQPSQIAGLSARLRSRLEAGLVAQLTPPSPAERLEIASAKAQSLSQELPPDVLRFVAEQPCTSVRELEGALHRVAAYSEFSDGPLTKEAVEHALYPFASNEEPSASQILETVCKHFSISAEEIRGPSRSREVTYARHIAMYLLRQNGSRALTEIGRMLGGRDHSTVLNACRRIKKERTAYPQTRVHIEQIESSLRNSTAA